MNENLKTELRALRLLIAFGIKTIAVILIIQQLIWLLWALVG